MRHSNKVSKNAVSTLFGYSVLCTWRINDECIIIIILHTKKHIQLIIKSFLVKWKPSKLQMRTQLLAAILCASERYTAKEAKAINYCDRTGTTTCIGCSSLIHSLVHTLLKGNMLYNNAINV